MLIFDVDAFAVFVLDSPGVMASSGESAELRVPATSTFYLGIVLNGASLGPRFTPDIILLHFPSDSIKYSGSERLAGQ